MNTQIILLFQISKEKAKVIEEIGKKLKAKVILINTKDYGQTIGYLAGIAGFKRQTAEQIFPINSEMLVFSGMTSQAIDDFLGEYKNTKLSPIALKAMATPHNIFWTADKLYQELMKERMSLI